VDLARTCVVGSFLVLSIGYVVYLHFLEGYVVSPICHRRILLVGPDDGRLTKKRDLRFLSEIHMWLFQQLFLVSLNSGMLICI